MGDEISWRGMTLRAKLADTGMTRNGKTFSALQFLHCSGYTCCSRERKPCTGAPKGDAWRRRAVLDYDARMTA